MAATKASPATEEPVKRTAAKAPAKKAPAKKAAKSAPAKATKPRAAKSADAPATRGRAKKATAPGAVDDDLAGSDVETGDDLVEAEPGDDLEVEDTDLVLDEELEVDDDTAVDGDSDDEDADEGAPKAAKPAKDGDDDGVAEPSEKDKASGDFVWDEEESEALRQARWFPIVWASQTSIRLNMT